MPKRNNKGTITYEEGGGEVEISKFTALSVKPRMTSSPRPGRTGFLNVSTSSSTITYEEGGEEVEISKFTALNVKPRMTSSPRPGRTGSGSRSSPSPTPPRQKFTCEQKNLARELKKDGKQPQEIIEIFKQRYGVVLKSSTLSTWYNTTNMANHERRGPTNTSMASVETHVNPTQRPTILIDMEFALVSMIKKYDNIVSVTRKGTLSKMGKSLFDKLRALDIYEDSGARLKPFSELSEERINTLLENASKDRVVCPLCETQLRSDSDNSLFVHIQEYHNPNDEEIRSPPGGKKYMFNGSDGWVRNFLNRHNKFETNNNCNKLSEFDVDEENQPQEIVKIFKDLCNVEVDNQNDGELDCDYIRTQLNSLPCVPGGICSCDTDFTSQVPEYIHDLFDMMPDNNTIIVVDQDKIVYI